MTLSCAALRRPYNEPSDEERFTMLHRNSLLIASLAASVLLLAGCTPPAPTPTSPPVATDEPSAPEENPLSEDALLEVTATATADNGAALSLRSVVHKSLAWDDPAAASLADLMSQVCDGSLETSVYDDQLWSFTKIEIFATPVDGTPEWPGDRPVHLLPYVGTDAIAADGIAVDDENVDIATPFCVRDKYLFGAGEGTIVLGLAGDTDEVTAAGNFTRWANTSYGFSVGEAQQAAADIGITITDCTYAVSLLGKEFGGQNESWEFGGSDSFCSVGVPFTGAN